MADKKRKVTTLVTEPPVKKTRRDNSSVQSTAAIKPNSDAKQQRASRKRAVDFLDAGVDADASVVVSAVTAENPRKRSKSAIDRPVAKPILKTNKPQKHSKPSMVKSTEPTVESSDSDVKIASEATSNSLQPIDSDEEEDDDVDQGAALLAGFDSDTEDPAADQSLDLSKTGAIPNYKKTSKKLREAAKKGKSGPGTVYVGRVPHGFYEKQMREYFSQFGDIKQLRLSRNRRTGASKHFAFIQFESDEVAKIVAETMDNYLMFGHILKCKYAPEENLHPDVWKGANKKFRKIPHQKLERQKLDAPKTAEQWARKNEKEQAKREKQAAMLQKIGYEFVAKKLNDPYKALEEKKRKAQAAIEDAPSVPVIEAAPAAVDPVAVVPHSDQQSDKTLQKDKMSKKDKKKALAAPLTEHNLGAQNADIEVAAAKGKGKAKSKKQESTPTVPSSTAPVQLSNANDDTEAKIRDVNDTTNVVPANTDASGDTATTPSKSKSKSKKPALSTAKSTSQVSDKGDYNDLSSIPLGYDAIEEKAAKAASAAAHEKANKLSEHLDSETSGVADAELKKRKKDRKAVNERDDKEARSLRHMKTAGPAVGVDVDMNINAPAPPADEVELSKLKKDKKERRRSSGRAKK